MRLEVSARVERRAGFRLEVDVACEAAALGVVGPSGAGKSTLLDVLAGIEPDGRVVVDGEDWTGRPIHERAVGHVSQDALLFPHLDVRPDVVVLDVDLAASTRTCLREIWPRLQPGGVLFSLDGQLKATHEILSDSNFWREEVGVDPPLVEGLAQDKLLTMRKG